jgi:hypothetical protein
MEELGKYLEGKSMKFTFSLPEPNFCDSYKKQVWPA